MTAYHAVPWVAFPLGADVMLILPRDGRPPVRVPSTTHDVLSVCMGSKPIEDHAAAAWRAGVTDNPSVLAAGLQTLVESGLLAAWADSDPVSQCGATRTSSRACLSTIGIITADRPAQLERCLASITRQCDAFGHTPQVVVVDGSTRPETRAAARAVVSASVTGRCLPHYVGSTEVDRLHRHLLAAGVPRHVLDFGLCPGTIGANRNIALLLGAAGNMVMVDDDIVCKPWTLKDCDNGVEVGGHLDMREWSFFRTRQEAVAAVEPSDADFFGAHAEILGQSLGSVLKGFPTRPDFRHACAHMTSAVTADTNYCVRMTFSGLAGDDARYCSHQLLFLPGPIRQLLLSDARTFEGALAYREVRRVARRTIVTHDPGGASNPIGISSCASTPPFMPIGRNEDLVFGAMLAFTDPLSLFVHLPYGVIHDSSRASLYNVDRMCSAVETRAGDFILSLIRLAANCIAPVAGVDRLLRLSHYLNDASAMPSHDFRVMVSEQVLRPRCISIGHLDAALSDPAYPDCWRAALVQYRAAFEAAVLEPEFLVPIECRTGDVASGLGSYQRYLRRFAELIEWWPALCASAREYDVRQNDTLSGRSLAAHGGDGRTS